MITRKTKLNFFQIVPKNSETASLDNVRENLYGLKNNQFKAVKKSGSVLILDNFRKVDNYYLGAIFNIQMSEIPPSMNTETLELQTLTLGDRDGLATATCFLLDPQSNILVIESNTGVTEQSFCSYLKKSIPALPKIEPAIIINPGQVQQFYKMSPIFKFEAKLAKINNGSLFNKENNSSVNQIINSADETNNDKLVYNIEISPDNRKKDKSLNKAKLSNFVSRFLNYKETEEVESLKISGKISSESKITTLELIKERLHDEIQYEIEDRLIGSFNIDQRLRQIETKYGNHREAIIKSYKIES